MFKTFATAALALSFAGAAMAEDNLTTAKFLASPPDAQKNFIANVAMTAGLIASQNRKGQGKCIDDWYAANAKTGFQPVIDAMKRLPDYHPNALILAVFEKSCGDLKYTSTASVSP
ncbi:MAG: hypothetical protein WC807_17140 [Hyphomicrobium sp.]|jgi:hypothetical protein